MRGQFTTWRPAPAAHGPIPLGKTRDKIDDSRICLRAERRLGELIRAQKETVGLNTGKRGDRGPRSAPRSDTRPTLAEVGIDKKLSSRAQKLAAGPEDEFEVMLGEWRERVGQENERVTTSFCAPVNNLVARRRLIARSKRITLGRVLRFNEPEPRASPDLPVKTALELTSSDDPSLTQGPRRH